MSMHPEVVRCTGDSATCRVPHGVWLGESAKRGEPVPALVAGQQVPGHALAPGLMEGRS